MSDTPVAAGRGLKKGFSFLSPRKAALSCTGQLTVSYADVGMAISLRKHRAAGRLESGWALEPCLLALPLLGLQLLDRLHAELLCSFGIRELPPPLLLCRRQEEFLARTRLLAQAAAHVLVMTGIKQAKP